MMGKKDFIADRSFLGKTIITSKRYSNIGPLVHTGKSQTSLLKSIHLKQLQEKQSETEYFSRIKPLAFAKLLYDTHTTTHDLLSLESTIQSTLSPKPIPPSLSYPKDKCQDSISPLLVDPDPFLCNSNQDTIYKRRIKNKWNGSAMTGYDATLPYLLLDIREDQDWKRGHIIGALPYPSSLLKHDQFNRDLILFKNKKEKSIILYDQDESAAAIIAQLLVEKGFDNIFILSGGLIRFLSKIQGAFIGEPSNPSPSISSPNFTLKPSSLSHRSSSSSSRLPKLPSLPLNSSSPSSLSALQPPFSLSFSIPSCVFDIEALEQSLTKVSSSAPSRASSRLSYRSTTESIPSTLSLSSNSKRSPFTSSSSSSSFSYASSRSSTARSNLFSSPSSPSSISRRGDSKRIHVS